MRRPASKGSLIRVLRRGSLLCKNLHMESNDMGGVVGVGMVSRTGGSLSVVSPLVGTSASTPSSISSACRSSPPVYPWACRYILRQTIGLVSPRRKITGVRPFQTYPSRIRPLCGGMLRRTAPRMPRKLPRSCYPIMLALPFPIGGMLS